MDEILRNWPAVVLLSSYGTLLRNNVSLDCVTSREVLAAVWARVRLLDGWLVVGDMVALQVYIMALNECVKPDNPK